MSDRQVPAAEFKAHCLQLLDQVQKSGVPLTVTKRGKPVAKLVPISAAKSGSLRGCMRGLVSIDGDLVEPTGETWEADGE